MDIPFSRWYLVVHRRRSRRHFDPNRPIEPGSLAALDRVCREFMPFTHARAYLVSKPVKDVFKGIVGGYGKVRGAPAFIAFIISSSVRTYDMSTLRKLNLTYHPNST